MQSKGKATSFLRSSALKGNSSFANRKSSSEVRADYEAANRLAENIQPQNQFPTASSTGAVSRLAGRGRTLTQDPSPGSQWRDFTTSSPCASDDDFSDAQRSSLAGEFKDILSFSPEEMSYSSSKYCSHRSFESLLDSPTLLDITMSTSGGSMMARYPTSDEGVGSPYFGPDFSPELHESPETSPLFYAFAGAYSPVGPSGSPSRGGHIYHGARGCAAAARAALTGIHGTPASTSADPHQHVVSLDAAWASCTSSTMEFANSGNSGGDLHRTAGTSLS
jgi:hypothetical protein